VLGWNMPKQTRVHRKEVADALAMAQPDRARRSREIKGPLTSGNACQSDFCLVLDSPRGLGNRYLSCLHNPLVS
jgi:hypothetical protein